MNPRAGGDPILVVVLHGDLPDPQYHYTFAERIAQSEAVVAAAILRPGYRDPAGDQSDGERGLTTGDNYTRDRIEMIAEGVHQLQQKYHARETMLVGHSGGAAISADLLALRPTLAAKALLVSCPCDVGPWRAHMKQLHPAPVWDQPIHSVSPLDVVKQVPTSDRVLLMVGTHDDVAPPRFTLEYAKALEHHGVNVQVVELDGRPHNILLEPEVQAQLHTLLQ